MTHCMNTHECTNLFAHLQIFIIYPYIQTLSLIPLKPSNASIIQHVLKQLITLKTNTNGLFDAYLLYFQKLSNSAFKNNLQL